VGGTAIGAFGIGSLFALLRYLKKPPKKNTHKDEKKELQEVQEQILEQLQEQIQEQIQPQEQNTSVGIQLGEGLSYMCVNTSDLEDIKDLLTKSQKRFHVLTAAPQLPSISS
jgi:flagellar biosynthesis component FlhA